MRPCIRAAAGLRGPVVALACLLSATVPAAAQAPPAGGFTSGSTLNAFAGMSTDGSESALSAGAAVGWELTPRWGVEASAAWFDRGPSAEAFAADFTALFSLTPPRRLVPFVKGGAGVYLTWFDLVESPIPDFYQRRIEPSPFGRTATFTDPALVLGGGVRAWLTENLALRPEVDAKLVVRGSHAYWLSTAALRLAYYFEDRPTTDRQPRVMAVRPRR